MSDDIDPEVLADLQLRASSQHDRSRARPSQAILGTWAPNEKPAGMWRCKGRGKGKEPCPTNAVVPVTADTIERMMAFNEMLRARDEPLLETDDIVRCERCQREINATRAVRLREREDNIGSLIRQLKQSNEPRKEQAPHAMIPKDKGKPPMLVTKLLEIFEHPDVEALMRSIEDQAKAPGGKGHRVRKDSL